jgi:catechol 2,3-dioxygenase-like lactoylglutathione lyase family enzyme
MTSPALRLTSVTIHSDRPRQHAAFYARLLGFPVLGADPPEVGDAGWVQLGPPAGKPGPRLNFEIDPSFRPPVWPSAPVEQQSMQHLDIEVDDLTAASEWAQSVGAVLAAEQPQPDVRVFLDPAGDPFCLFVPGGGAGEAPRNLVSARELASGGLRGPLGRP